MCAKSLAALWPAGEAIAFPEGNGAAYNHPMAARRLHEAIEPMTLGNMRANGARSLDVSCWQCHHRTILGAYLWSDHVPVPAFGPRSATCSDELVPIVAVGVVEQFAQRL
jgi:cytochrome c5